MQIRSALILLTGALAACAATGSANGPTFNTSADVSLVPFVVSIAGYSCNSLLVDVTARAPDGKLKLAQYIAAKTLFHSGPRVATFEPGEYHISGLKCEWTDLSSLAIKTVAYNIDIEGFTTEMFSKTYNQTFASFTVPPRKMVNIGHLIIHLGPDYRIARMEVAELPPQHHAALKAEYPAAYANIEKKFIRPAPDAIGAQAKAIQKTTTYHVNTVPAQR